MLTEKQLEAVALVATGKATIPEIAQVVGVSPRTIDNWKADPTFQQEVHRKVTAWRSRGHEGIGDPDRRQLRRNDRWRRLQAVIEARSQDPEIAKVPGGATGLVTITRYRERRYVENDQACLELVPEYAVDTGLLAEMRALEQDGGIEEGQWKKKVEDSAIAAEAPPEVIALAKLMTPAQVVELQTKLKAALSRRAETAP